MTFPIAAKIMVKTSNYNPYNEGWCAYYAGMDSCPYEYDDADISEWWQGWNDARKLEEDHG